MVYKILGAAIELTEDETRFRDELIKFKSEANHLISGYMEKYSKYGKLDTFIETGFSDGCDVVLSYLTEIQRDIVAAGKYDFDAISAAKEHDVLVPWFEEYEKIQNTYVDIVADEETKQRYRRERKDNRGRFVGGGFGLSGAIKGAATAGVLNATTGIAHSAYNFLGNVASGIKASRECDKVYNARSTKDNLRNGLNGSLNKAFSIYCKYLKIETSSCDYNSIRTIISNFPMIPREKQRAVLVDCLKKNPYIVQLYETAVREFGDEDGAIQLMSSDFGYSDTIQALKQELIRKELKIDDELSLIDAVKLETEVVTRMKRYGVSESPTLEEVQTLIVAIDVKERTAYDTVYSTKWEAINAEKAIGICSVATKKMKQGISFSELISFYGELNAFSKEVKETPIIMEVIGIMDKAIDDYLQSDNYEV